MEYAVQYHFKTKIISAPVPKYYCDVIIYEVPGKR